VVDPSALPALLARDPSASANVLKKLVQRLLDAEDQIEITMLSDTQSKVVAALIKLAQKARVEGPGASFVMSPMELGTRVGLDVDTVKRTVQQLRDGQYLRVNDGRLEVPDLEALRRLYTLLGVKDDIRSDV
jgi:CRP-like cAMP-binding protein